METTERVVHDLSRSGIAPDAPTIIHDLVRLFEERCDELYHTARRLASEQDQGTSRTCHVDVPAGAMMMTVVFDVVANRFTQLIARAAEEAHHERPTYTISVFL